MAIKFDSKRSVLVEVSVGGGDAPLEKHNVRVTYRTMTAREQATVRAQYAAMQAREAASPADKQELASLGGSEDVALGLARSLILGLEDEAGEPVTFDGLTWQGMSDEQRQNASVGLGGLLVEVLKLAGGTASARLLGK